MKKSIEIESKNEKWHACLEEILNSPDTEAISAVRQNLRVFHRIARAYGTGTASNHTTTRAEKKNKP
jgi:hypothetical protein